MKKLIQGTSVAINNQAILIIGKSGVGKTTLALKLLEQGAKLISDDITEVVLSKNRLYCRTVQKLYSKIEIRGLGIIEGMPVVSDIPLTCIIQLNSKKTERFPKEIKKTEILGKKVPFFEFFSCENTYIQVLYALKVINGELTLLKE